MKRKFLIVCFTAISLSTIIGCKKKSDTSPDYKGAATVNAQLFTGQSSSTTQGPLLEIFCTSASNSIYPKISIGITTFTGVPGTFTIDGNSATARIDSGDTKSTSAVYGSVIISNITATSITGSFNFTCSDSTKVINGSFISSRN